MIKLKREEKPNVLNENERVWTSRLSAAITEYGSYSELPKKLKEKLLVHYRHRDIKDSLFASSLQKCAFCETKPGESGNIEVEHFAPKSIYPSLAFTWSNFLPACRKCNGSKDTHDSLREPIVNPYDIDPEEVFHYKDIKIAANDNKHRDSGELTIKVCGLNSVRLMQPRADILVSLHSFSEALEEAIADFNEVDSERKKIARKRKIREALEAIERMANPSEKFSGFCKNYLKNCQSYNTAKQLVETG